MTHSDNVSGSYHRISELWDIDVSSYRLSFFSLLQAHRDISVPDIDLREFFCWIACSININKGLFPLAYSLGGPAAFIAATYSAPAK
jgi:hypothetical protein